MVMRHCWANGGASRATLDGTFTLRLIKRAAANNIPNLCGSVVLNCFETIEDNCSTLANFLQPLAARLTIGNQKGRRRERKADCKPIRRQLFFEWSNPCQNNNFESGRRDVSTNQRRREFLKASIGAVSTFVISPNLLTSAQPSFASLHTSPHDRLNIGVIGCGGMGQGNIDTAKDWLNVIAIADVDTGHLEAFNQRFAEGKADASNDYRKMLDRDDIDVIHIATPDHWHTKPLVEAMLAGKDVYCEKPLTLTIDEGKLLEKIQRDTGRIVQVGTQQRSTFDNFVKAMAIVQQGRLGKIERLEVSIGGAPTSPPIPVAEIPKLLDWDRWLGPAPKVDYRFLKSTAEGTGDHSNCHYEFRWWYEYSGGKLTDWGAHHVDIATWALQLNGQDDVPLSIVGTAEHPVKFAAGMPVERDRYNTATKFRFNVRFPGNVEMIIKDDDNGVLIEGDKGRIFVNRGKLTGQPVEQLADDPLPADALQKVYKGLPMEGNERAAHWANFIHCVKSRQEPISDVASHCKMLNICHLAGISARFGRELKWDAKTSQIVGDEQANSFLARLYRAGYEIEM